MTIREDGLQVIREMMGTDAAKKMGEAADSQSFGAPVVAYAIDQAFADIWTRPVLDRKARSLITIAIMVALRQPHEFGIHMTAGLANGLTLEEVQEILVQVLPYVGYPAVSTALKAAQEVIKQRGLEQQAGYEGHSGLL